MGDVTWNRVGCFDNKNSIYRWIQSPRSAFLCLLQSTVNGRFQKTKGFRPLVSQNQPTIVTYCRSSLSPRRSTILQFSLLLCNSIVIEKGSKSDNGQRATIGNNPSLRRAHCPTSTTSQHRTPLAHPVASSTDRGSEDRF